jgi:hypothetical protein
MGLRQIQERFAKNSFGMDHIGILYIKNRRVHGYSGCMPRIVLRATDRVVSDKVNQYANFHYKCCIKHTYKR